VCGVSEEKERKKETEFEEKRRKIAKNNARIT
jgi:hypothetical protein